MRASRLMKEAKDAKILINIAFEENIFKHFFSFRKKFKSLRNEMWHNFLPHEVRLHIF